MRIRLLRLLLCVLASYCLRTPRHCPRRKRRARRQDRAKTVLVYVPGKGSRHASQRSARVRVCDAKCHQHVPFSRARRRRSHCRAAAERRRRRRRRFRDGQTERVGGESWRGDAGGSAPRIHTTSSHVGQPPAAVRSSGITARGRHTAGHTVHQLELPLRTADSWLTRPAKSESSSQNRTRMGCARRDPPAPQRVPARKSYVCGEIRESRIRPRLRHCIA